jgi:hypothetical protein
VAVVLHAQQCDWVRRVGVLMLILKTIHKDSARATAFQEGLRSLKSTPTRQNIRGGKHARFGSQHHPTKADG